MSLIREFIGWQNRPFQGGISVKNPDGTVQVLAGTYEINLYRHPSATPFATGTVGGGQLTVNGAAGTIDFLFATALMTAAPGYGSAEIVDTSVAGGRVLNVIPLRLLPQGSPHQPEYNERLVLQSNSATILVEPIDAGGAIVAEGGYVDVTVSALGLTWTINNNVVNNAKLADMAAGTIKANITGASADPVDVTRAAFVPWLDLQASEIEVTPSGGIAATTVAAALSELDSEKLAVGANAVSASAWATGRTITLTGQVTGLSGAFDGSGNLSFATTLANNTVTDAQLRTSAALTIIGRSANSVGNVADIAAANGSAAVLRESGGVLGFGTVATGGIANDAVDNTKLANMAANTIKANITGAGADPVDVTRAAFVPWLALVGSEVANTPAGNIAATTVQAAINELDTEKLATAGGTISGNLTITGNLTLNGTTYQVNATQVTYDDIILVIGGDTAPVADDAKDRGIEFRWHNGTTAKLGFFGFDRSTQEFLFVPDATDTADVITGTAGTFKGSLNGNAVTASAWATGRTITLTGQVTGLSGAFDGSANLSFATALANNTVSDAQLRTSGALSIIGRSANSVGNVADIATANGSNAVLRESGGVLGFGTVATGGIANDAVDNTKLANMAANTIKANITGAGADPVDVTRAAFVPWLALAGSEVANTPAGDIAAVTVQAAINELDSEKAGRAVANSFTAGAKQTVSHSATTAGLNIAPVAGDPSAPVDGDVWYNATTAKFRKRENGASSDLASAGGGGGLTDAYVAITDGTNSAAASSGDTLKFRAENGLRVTVGSNDVTHGDNVLVGIDDNSLTLAKLAPEVMQSANASLAADVTMPTSNTFYDGAVLAALPAGTWLVMAHAQYQKTTTTASQVTARITDGSTHYASQNAYHASLANITIGFKMATVITLAGATDIKVQLATSVGNAACLIKAATGFNGSGNNATQITAIRIA